MSVRITIAIDVSDELLRAVEVRRGRGAVDVVRAICAARPESVDLDDVAAVGRWMGDTLRHAGFPAAGDVLIGLDRERCGLRTIELPTDDPAELPDMARLAVQRETPAEAGALVIDIVARESVERSTRALVATVPERTIRSLGQLLAAAGYRPARITPRTLGTAWLLRSVEQEGRVAVGVDLPGDGVEVLAVTDGEIRFSRGARIDAEGREIGIVSEIRRSLATWRLGAGELAIGVAVAYGDAASFARAREALHGVVDAPIEAFDGELNGIVALRIDDGVDRDALARSWPLVGLLLEAGAGEETINLAAPRRAPDLGALRRTRILAATGAIVVAALIGWTAGRQSWKSLEAEVEATSEQVASATPMYEKYKRDTARNLHVSMWRRAAPEWLDHLRFLHDFASDPSTVVLDRWSGTLDASDVQYGRDGKWSIEHEVKILVQGEARDRTVADAFRDALVDNGTYSLTSTGPDTEGGRRLKSPFSYVLRSRDPHSPLQPAAAPAGGQP